MTGAGSTDRATYEAGRGFPAAPAAAASSRRRRWPGSRIFASILPHAVRMEPGLAGPTLASRGY